MKVVVVTIEARLAESAPEFNPDEYKIQIHSKEDCSFDFISPKVTVATVLDSQGELVQTSEYFDLEA